MQALASVAVVCQTPFRSRPSLCRCIGAMGLLGQCSSSARHMRSAHMHVLWGLCEHVCVCAYACMCACACLCLYFCARMRVCVCGSVCVYVRTRLRRECARVCVCVCVCALVRGSTRCIEWASLGQPLCTKPSAPFPIGLKCALAHAAVGNQAKWLPRIYLCPLAMPRPMSLPPPVLLLSWPQVGHHCLREEGMSGAAWLALRTH